MSLIPLPPKKIADLNARELHVFKQWIGHAPGGGSVPGPTPEERRTRRRRERWKQRYAGKGNPNPTLLIKAEQLARLRQNAQFHPAAKKWREQIFQEADELVGLDQTFWSSFISELGPWNCRGNYCPHCIGRKSGEGLNLYFWDWHWRDPDKLRCPHCGIVFPDMRYPENGELVLPRLNRRYTFYLRPEETATADWRLGEKAARYVGEPVHVSFTGNIRAMKLAWALGRATPLALAYAISRRKKYARTLQHILRRMAEVYPGYPLHSYLQDTVDADPGYAVEQADCLPTVFKRNACFSAYQGGPQAFFHGETTTEKTKVASGLWGASRLAPEMAATADTFVTLFQAYDLIKAALPQADRVRIEQDFLLELYLDVKAYTPITNKAGPVRAARVAFGLCYDHPRELQAGLDGFQAILAGQFYPDGSLKEAPVYGHKPIGEGLWRIPEMVRGRIDLYAPGPYRRALQTLVEIATPTGWWPPCDDSYAGSRLPPRTADIARLRCGIPVPGPRTTPSDFALINENLAVRIQRVKPRVLNRYYADRRLACLGLGSGPNRIQLYLSGTDGLTGHRHFDLHNLQLFAGRWEVFPDLGYLWDHPGKKWATATPSHQTVTVNEQNSHAASPSELLAFVDRGPARHVDMRTKLAGGTMLRRAVTLIRKPDGLPLLIDVFEVSGPGIHDYAMRAQVPSSRAPSLKIPQADPVFFSPVGSQDNYVPPTKPGQPTTMRLGRRLRPRPREIYQEHSHYPLKNFKTGGKTQGGWQATWQRGLQRVTAHVLSDCDELITYQSPAWRSQSAVAAEPHDYTNSVVLRRRAHQSRFVVVYEMSQGSPRVVHTACTTMTKQLGMEIGVQLGDGRQYTVSIPEQSMLPRGHVFRVVRNSR